MKATSKQGRLINDASASNRGDAGSSAAGQPAPLLRRLLPMFRSRQRGSALLVTLMVIVGLSLLGLGYVSISETESAISINQRNYNQVLSIAEAGAKAVVEMFQRPDGALDAGILPANLDVFKNVRYQDKEGTVEAVDKYKADASWLLFDKPHKPRNVDRFLCTERNPDVIIDRSNTQGVAYLDSLNNALFIDREGGEITEILVYAPPITGGVTNAQNCIDGGTRYGLATIRVTARKFDNSGNKNESNVIAQRTVKITISEWPFPGPQGPVQSNANIATGGNLGVHWGKMTSEEDMEFANPVVALPWHDATNRVHFDRGYYNSSYEWVASGARKVGQVLRPTTAAITADAELKKYEYRIIGSTLGAAVGTEQTSGATEPTWPKTIGDTLTDGNLTLEVQYSTDYPLITGSTNYDDQPWFSQLLERTFTDPWMEVRAGGNLANVAGLMPHPYKYSDPAQNVTATGIAGYSSWFQDQDQTLAPDKLDVIFPKMDYNFWKEVAQSGRQEDGVFYLKHVGGENYTDGVVTKNFGQWTNTVTGAQSGFYFFDTKNQLNPQGVGAPGILADPIILNASDAGPVFLAQGFFYINATQFGSQGIGGPDGWHNSPGEPYRDVGFRKVDTTVTPHDWEWDGTNFTIIGASDGRWSYQDVNENGQFDVFVAQRTIVKADGSVATVWMPVPWFPGCTPGMNTDAGANCSEPHEPYLNLVYSQKCRVSAGLGSAPRPFKVSFDPAQQTYLPSRVGEDGQPVVATCDAASDPRNCTSLRYDDLGALVNDMKPFFEGVVYNEGAFENTTGNAIYYGSLLIQGNVGKGGTPQVWFDEKLIKGQWPPDSFNFPRVLISSIRTDE
jgi:hypothetical protein